jgi:L-seryl-tRNA(Ser) seleniumtransferase
MGGRMPEPEPVPQAPLSPEAREALRSIPQVDDLLRRDEVRAAVERHGATLALALLRERLESLRAAIRATGLTETGLASALADIGVWVETEARARTTSTLRPVINATGVILHTNLGRAVLSEEAARRMLLAARSYTTLEYDLNSGGRGSRAAHLDRLFALLFPGHAGHVVNNNAAAVLLALNTFAEGKEVVVSRGELVEIGGSFRIPDVMRKSGAFLHEVGTTNKTKLADYERAISSKTGLLLKVHPSNYRIVGFTAEVPLADLAALGRRARVPVLMDQGSGNLVDLAPRGIRREPTVQEALAAGADLVTCSCDKLLGGPQAGLLLGRPDLVRAARDNSLSRALRADKTTCAALEQTLLEFLRGRPAETLPVMRMIALDAASLESRARRLVETVTARAPGGVTLALMPGMSLLGGGSAPEEGLPTTLVAIGVPGISARAVEERLRGRPEPVIARIENDRVVLDLRTVLEEQEPAVVEALASLAAPA